MVAAIGARTSITSTHARDCQVVLVTGATDGIGRLVARDLAARGATVLVHGRSTKRGSATVAEIRAVTGNERVTFYRANFASLAEVRRAAAVITANHDQLHVLVNNAGLLGAGRESGPRELSQDGHELRFQVNYLAPLLLTRLLLPLLRRAAADVGEARVVTVASGAQQPLDFDDLMLERAYDRWNAYARSKLADTMFTLDLAEELAGTGVTANSLHPGSLLDTKMIRDTLVTPLSPAQAGADAIVHLATSPELTGVSGRYYDEMHEARAHPQVYDPEARRHLRELTYALVDHGTSQCPATT